MDIPHAFRVTEKTKIQIRKYCQWLKIILVFEGFLLVLLTLARDESKLQKKLLLLFFSH